MSAAGSISGSAVLGLPPRSRTYAANRVCAAPGCGTRLSVYSKWRHCWQHEPVHRYETRGRRRWHRRDRDPQAS